MKQVNKIIFFIICIAKLDVILNDAKNVFVVYGHSTQEEWSQVLACEACNNGSNSQLEMKGLKSFLDQHPGIKGLLISNLELDVRTNFLS
jgi:hypothetical protein